VKISNFIQTKLFVLILILLAGCATSLVRSVDELKPIPYDQGFAAERPYKFEDVVPLVREALESDEAKLVLKEEQIPEDGKHVFYARTTFMKMDFDPGAIVRVVVERSGEQGDQTYLYVIQESMTHEGGMTAFKAGSDYREIIVMKLDSVLKASEMEERYKHLE
jgi:hypothetical protein